MLRLLSAQEVNRFEEKEKRDKSLDTAALVENAARLAFASIEEDVRSKHVLILAGPGNNGSDALSLSLLLDNSSVSILLVKGKRGSINLDLLKKVEEKGIRITDEIENPDVIIDGIYGSSFHPPLDCDTAALIEKANNTDALKIALDIPSAFLFEADKTISFTFYKKECFYPENRKKCGRLFLSNPGFDEKAVSSVLTDTFLIEDSDYKKAEEKDWDYKNTKGHLLIKGGSDKYPGAAIISARAAFCSSIGLVSLKSRNKNIVYQYPQIINGEDEDGRYDAVLAGPGWGNDRSHDELATDLPLVIDADGLKAIEKGDYFSFNAVLTPHVGEFRFLCTLLGIAEDVRTLSRTLGAVVVKKSHIVEISDGVRMFIYDGMNSSLAIAGSGDVLSAIIATFMAKGQKPLDAAVNATIVHQKSGRSARKKYRHYDILKLLDEVALNI